METRGESAGEGISSGWALGERAARPCTRVSPSSPSRGCMLPRKPKGKAAVKDGLRAPGEGRGNLGLGRGRLQAGRGAGRPDAVSLRQEAPVDGQLDPGDEARVV